MNVVQVRNKFSWKSLGTKLDKYLKCTLSEEQFVLQSMTSDTFKMFYTNICHLFFAAEKSPFVSRENTTNAAITCKLKLKQTNRFDSECFQMGFAMYSIFSELI